MKTEIYIATETGFPQYVTLGEGRKIPEVNEMFWVGNICYEVLDKYSQITRDESWNEIYRVQLQVTKIAESHYPRFTNIH